MSASPVDPLPTERTGTSTTPPPSVRFWESKRNNVGAILAILAGVMTLGFKMWGIAVPQARGDLGFFWGILAVVIGAAYLWGFFSADKHWQRARTILFAAAGIHILTGLASGLFADAQGLSGMFPAALYDLVPAAIAIAAAFLIGKPPTPSEYREMHAADHAHGRG